MRNTVDRSGDAPAQAQILKAKILSHSRALVGWDGPKAVADLLRELATEISLDEIDAEEPLGQDDEAPSEGA